MQEQYGTSTYRDDRIIIYPIQRRAAQFIINDNMMIYDLEWKDVADSTRGTRLT